MRKIGLSLFAGAMLLGAMACDDGVADKIENRIDCRKICRDYAECFKDDDYDVTECAQECADESKNDDFEDLANACAGCLRDGDTCREDVSSCTAKCAGVVAQSQQ